MGRVADGDRQPQLGSAGLAVFEEAGEGGDSAVEGQGSGCVHASVRFWERTHISGRLAI